MTLDQLITKLNETIPQTDEFEKWFLTKTDEGMAWIAFVIDDETDEQEAQNYPSGFPLVLSQHEKDQLTAYYIDTVRADFLEEYPTPEYEDNHWSGIKIGNRMFDLCVYWSEKQITCLVYECDMVGDNWQTNTNHEWLLTGETEE